jgi:hypothetical protein
LQAATLGRERGEPAASGGAVAGVGVGDQHRQDEADRVDDQVPLPPLIFLPLS